MTRPRASMRVLFVVAAGAALLGCGTVGLGLDELPTDPIAVIWWEPEPARRRAEILVEQQQAEQKRGVAEVKAIGRLLGAEEDPGNLSRYPGRLALIDPQTARVTTVTQAPPGALPLAWSDDHERLLFLSNHRGGIQVYEYDRIRDEVRTVTSGRHHHLWADYGRGRQLALMEVVTQEGRRFERVFVTDVDGRSPRKVFEDRNAETVRLAPDGKTLLYVRRPTRASRPGAAPESPTLMSVDLDSGEERPLGRGREPAFSPIGDWIVYSAPSRDGWRLRRMRPDGSARSPVTSGIRDEKMPAVSPDGRFVVYVRETTGIERLFVRRLDGSGDRNLLDEGAVFAPVW
jgi:Tol biopolymer transport system component